ncbi:Gfo/Idh/MocA family protein [Mycolicibacterium neoaurum]|uniref:Gfo/Idh/MocA family protein n=1 Tax=Mycolicibacterium neoaurum TaxID=1795 RepID=UPI001F4CA2EE|nr:Gfo/Idh/MocA family oxidoreductase [Mycolicibacterium neoaurum]
MRLGVIGLGRIGTLHLDTLANIPSVESLNVFDHAPDRIASAIKTFGSGRVTGVNSIVDLLNCALDGVVIATNTDSHSELIIEFVEAGVAVFCEKPVAGTAAAGAAVCARLSDSSVPVQIGFQRRHDSGFIAARAAVDRGDLGFVTTVRSTTLDPSPPPPQFVSTSGGLFRDCGVHDFDAIRWITGQEVIEVYATGSNQGATFFKDYEDVDTSAILLKLSDGTLGLVSNTRYNGRGYDVRIEVHGSRDSVAAGIDDGWPIRSTQPGIKFPAGDPYRWYMDRFRDAYRSEIQTFVEVAAGATLSTPTLLDGLAADRIAEACALSHREHRPVCVDEVCG